MRFLVADGDDEYRSFTSRVLRDHGAAHVATATTGIEAVAMALERKFDVLFIELKLKEVSGIEVAQTLRLTGYKRWIIAFTGCRGLTKIDAAMHAGFDDYLIKPLETRFRRDTLRELVFVAKTIVPVAASCNPSISGTALGAQCHTEQRSCAAKR